MSRAALVPILRPLALLALAAALSGSFSMGGCASVGRLKFVPQPLTPADTTGEHPVRRTPQSTPMGALFGVGDTLIGFVANTADSSKRYLGRLRHGYTADTLNIILVGDNRPGYRLTRLNPQLAAIRAGLSPNPIKIVKGLVNIPIAIVKGLVPDLALIREIPTSFRHMPTWGREKQVLQAVLAKLDTLQAHKEMVAAVINTGDIVQDGRRPAHWERFLRLNQPLSSRVPYFAVAGNHEKTWTVEGVENWRTATGLPVGGDRLYYCFDSADGWVRFIALDSNPMTEPGVHWSREVQVRYSKEELDWLTRRIKEHRGPSFVFMHAPPFSAGFHRMEWQMDDVLQARREQLVRAMHEGGISVLATGHEHDYERALLIWPDGSVLINIVQGGGGAPLHPLPPPAECARLFSEYKVAGSTVRPEDVYAGAINNFVHLRLWFGGGQLFAFAVDQNGNAKLVDNVKINLKRYGIPKIDQKKIPIPPTGPTHPSSMQTKMEKGVQMKSDTTGASKRIETQPPPGKGKRRSRSIASG